LAQASRFSPGEVGNRHLFRQRRSNQAVIDSSASAAAKSPSAGFGVGWRCTNTGAGGVFSTS
jgi:hypothetical protein